MFAILGAVFSSWRIYMLIGAAMLIMAVGTYIFYLRAEVATAGATIAVQSAALQTDAGTISNLQVERDADNAALTAVAQGNEKIAAVVSSIKEQINAIPEPKTCQALDPRDNAAVSGVRRIIAPGSANQHN